MPPLNQGHRRPALVVAYPRQALSATKRTNYAPNSFDQQVKVSQGHTSNKNKENWNTEVHGVTPAGTSNELDVQNGWEENTHTHTHGGGGLELVKPVREPASSRPKICASLKKVAAPCGLRKEEKLPWSDISFSLRNLRFTPLILAHRGSVLP